MKIKNIFFLFLLFLGTPIFSQQVNQIFIGGTLGMGNITKFNNEKELKESYSAFTWGLRGGYEFLPIKYLGVRIYLDYLMAIKPFGLGTITSSVLSINADTLINIVHINENAFGFYGGIGFGAFKHSNVVQNTPEDKAFVSDYTGVLNLGILATLKEFHRVEIGAKLPFTQTKSLSESHITYQDIYFIASYSFLF